MSDDDHIGEDSDAELLDLTAPADKQSLSQISQLSKKVITDRTDLSLLQGLLGNKGKLYRPKMDFKLGSNRARTLPDDFDSAREPLSIAPVETERPGSKLTEAHIRRGHANENIFSEGNAT